MVPQTPYSIGEKGGSSSFIEDILLSIAVLQLK